MKQNTTPSTSPTDMTKFSTLTVPVLLIRQGSLLPQYQHYIYDTVTTAPVPALHIRYSHYCPSTSATYTKQSLLRYNTLQPSTSPTHTAEFTIVPVTVLHIRYSTLLSQYQRTSTTYTIQFTASTVPVLHIRCSAFVPQNKNWVTDTQVGYSEVCLLHRLGHLASGDYKKRRKYGISAIPKTYLQLLASPRAVIRFPATLVLSIYVIFVRFNIFY